MQLKPTLAAFLLMSASLLTAPGCAPDAPRPQAAPQVADDPPAQPDASVESMRYRVLEVRQDAQGSSTAVFTADAPQTAHASPAFSVSLNSGVSASDAEEIVNFLVSSPPGGQVGELNSITSYGPSLWSVWTTLQRTPEHCNSGLIIQVLREDGRLQVKEVVPWVS